VLSSRCSLRHWLPPTRNAALYWRPLLLYVKVAAEVAEVVVTLVWIAVGSIAFGSRGVPQSIPMAMSMLVAPHAQATAKTAGTLPYERKKTACAAVGDAQVAFQIHGDDRGKSHAFPGHRPSFRGYMSGDLPFDRTPSFFLH
jgi:hypothetical protein